MKKGERERRRKEVEKSRYRQGRGTTDNGACRKRAPPKIFGELCEQGNKNKGIINLSRANKRWGKKTRGG